MAEAAAFFIAVQDGHATRVRTMLDADMTLLHRYDDDGWAPLHLAAFYGRASVTRLLLDRGADPTQVSTNATANQPLHAALAGARDGTVVDLLLGHGADANATAAGGVTPLHLAASRGDLSLIDRLLVAGAEACAMDDGRRPADLAEERDHPEAAAYLRERKA